MLFLFYYGVPGVSAVFDIKCKIVNWFLSRLSAPSPLVQVTPDFCFQSRKKKKKKKNMVERMRLVVTDKVGDYTVTKKKPGSSDRKPLPTFLF